MDSKTLEARVASLERSLRGSRLAAAILGVGALVVAAAAFAQQPGRSSDAELEARASRLVSAVQEQTQEQVSTRRLTLVDETGAETIVLTAEAVGSMLVASGGGQEILRIGGPAARRIDH